jgi:hypothetical protein
MGDPECEEPERGGRDIPDLIRYQLRDGPHASEPTTGRGEIERLARDCQAAGCDAGLASTVVETRFNVVRSSVPETVTTTRRLRDYLRPEARRRPAPQAVGSFGRAGRVGRGLVPWWPVARAWLLPRRCGVDVA